MIYSAPSYSNLKSCPIISFKKVFLLGSVVFGRSDRICLVDEMATRVDELEQNINEVMKQVRDLCLSPSLSDRSRTQKTARPSAMITIMLRCRIANVFKHFIKNHIPVFRASCCVFDEGTLDHRNNTTTILKRERYNYKESE